MVTTLADYCHQRGWEVLKEYVDIAVPMGKDMREFLQAMREGKIIVLNSNGQGKESDSGQ